MQCPRKIPISFNFIRVVLSDLEMESSMPRGPVFGLRGLRGRQMTGIGSIGSIGYAACDREMKWADLPPRVEANWRIQIEKQPAATPRKVPGAPLRVAVTI